MPRDTPTLAVETGRRDGHSGRARSPRRPWVLAGTIIAAGLVLLATVWFAIYSLIATERQTAIQAAETNAANLSAGFEEEICSTLNGVAGAMGVIAERMRSADGHFDIHGWARDIPQMSAVVARASVIGPDGTLISTTRDAHPEPLDLSDREQFRVHVSGRFKGVFVSKPVVGRSNGLTTIKLSQRVESADGRFLGVVVFSLDPGRLTDLHHVIDLGKQGLMAVIGASDGIIRARFGAESPNGTVGVGTVVAGDALRDDQPDIHVAQSNVDQVVRIYSRRRVPGYDLIAAVGLSLNEALEPAEAHATRIEIIGMLVTLLIGVLTVVLAVEVYRRSMREVQLDAELRRREQIEADLRASELRLRDFANLSSDWFWEQDAELRFTSVGAGAPLLPAGSRAIVGKRRWELNDATNTSEHWEQHRQSCLAHEPFRDFRYTRATPEGRIAHVSISGVPLFDESGVFLGYRGTGRDITAEVQAAAELRAAKERAEQAEVLLRDAVDSISEGFVIYDRDDRFVLCNDAYRELYHGAASLMMPGAKFEDIVRRGVRNHPMAMGKEEAWVAQRLQQHANAGEDVETQRPDGRWVLVTERRMRNGGIAGLRVDITRLKQAQIALSESEHRLRDFADTSSDWFWEQDAELRFTWLSGAAEQAMGGIRSFVGKRRWESPSARATSDELWDEHRSILAARQPFRDFRYTLYREDGSLWHVSISGKPMFTDDGAFLGYRGTGRDMTRAVEAEAELRSAKERAELAEALLRDAVDSISEGFVIYDKDDRLVLCNEAYRRIYPASAHLMKPGTRFEDLVRNSVASGHYPAAAGNEDTWIEEFIRCHREADSEFEQQLQDGTWILVSERPMRNGGIAGLRMNITALKKAQLALRLSEARLDRAQEIAGIGSWELDLATGECLWSHEMYSLRGLTPDEFQPCKDNIGQFMDEEDVPLARQWFTDLEAGAQRAAIDLRIVRSDGVVRICNAEGRAVVDPDGRVIKLIGTMQDVTERRLTEQKLVHAQKMETIGQLSGGMAHDFNNVLGVIIGNLDLLGRRIKCDPLAEELRSEASEAALRGADLTRRLLAFARRQPLRPQKTCVNALVDGLAKLLTRMLGENVTLNLHLGDQIWPVVVDPAQLEAALSNLAANARDAMPKGGRLDIITRNIQLDASYAAQHPEVAHGPYVLIEVSDTGTGIPRDILTQIFEPFFTTKEPGKGSGLGLSMVFGFIKQSGGHVAVYSEMGLGTTFRLYLPRGSNDSHLGDERDEVAPVEGGNETVLVVEDNEQLRRVTVQGLRILGYEVREAENAAAALDVLAAYDDVQLLFTDVVMPGEIDGLELASRATVSRPGLKLLLTSGFPDMRSTGKGQSAMASGYRLLNKPYRHDELAQAVREALDARNVELTES